MSLVPSAVLNCLWLSCLTCLVGLLSVSPACPLVVLPHTSPLRTEPEGRAPDAQSWARRDSPSAFPFFDPALWMTWKENGCKARKHLAILLLFLLPAIHVRCAWSVTNATADPVGSTGDNRGPGSVCPGNGGNTRPKFIISLSSCLDCHGRRVWPRRTCGRASSFPLPSRAIKATSSLPWYVFNRFM